MPHAEWVATEHPFEIKCRSEYRPSMPNFINTMSNIFLAFLWRESISHLEIKVGLSVRLKIGCAAAPDVMKTMQNIRVYQDEQKAHKQRLR